MRLLPRERAFVGLAAAFAGLALLGVVVARLLFDVPPYESTVDPTTVGGLPAWTGWLSNLGVMVWIAGASCALLAAAILPSGERRTYLALFGVYAAWLGVDDVYWIHEAVGRALLGSESGEDIVYAFYAVIVLATLWRFRLLILRETPVVVLLAAGFFFAMSIVLDRPGAERTGQFLFEDGAKFTGIVFLTSYLALTARRFLLGRSHDGTIGSRPEAGPSGVTR